MPYKESKAKLLSGKLTAKTRADFEKTIAETKVAAHES